MIIAPRRCFAIDTPFIYQYKHAMKRIQTTFGLILSFILAACSSISIPLGPTAAPSATSTSIPSPGPTETPTFTPAPAINPLTRFQTGEQALFYGDYETARAEYGSAYRDGDNDQVQTAALWGLARTEYADRRYSAALDALDRILNEFPDSAFIPYANFLLGETNYELERYQQAADAYDVYLQLRPGVLDAYVQELRGDALFANGNFGEALAAYETSLSAPQVGNTTTLEVKIAQTRAEIGDYASAIAAYEAIFTHTENDFIKAQMDYLAGLAHMEIGQTDLAYEKYLQAVENYPLSYYAYLSLVELVDAGVPVSDLDRGLVDYFAGQYAIGLAALERYIAEGLDSDGTALYYRALTQRELQYFENAINDFSLFIANYPNNPHWANAWQEKASTQWFSTGNYVNGAQTYLDFVDAAPTHLEAPDFLMSAARVLERDNRLEQAAKTWQRVADEYPQSDTTSQALFLAGIVQYRRGDFYQALPIFQRSLLLSVQKEDQARAYLWIGKTHQQLGDSTAMLSAWKQAQAIDPTGYYSERAKDLLIGRTPFEAPMQYDIKVDLEREREEAAAWIRIQFGLPPETNLDGLGPLAGDPRIVRGTEFRELGLYEQARGEFEDLRAEVSTSPENSFRLANYLLDIGLYRPAIFAARQVLTLAGLDDHAKSLGAPAYFNHVRYGTYYADLIIPAAEENGLHPLFLFSVVRQESLFEGFVRSTAGARGLMQIIPSTGGSIANQLGWPINYQAEDLYRPIVSIRLGANYLGSNRDLLGKDIYAALAAYNAGPGNASIWKQLSGDDPDLSLEVIRFQETRNYIRSIFEIYEIYQTLYSPAID